MVMNTLSQLKKKKNLTNKEDEEMATTRMQKHSLPHCDRSKNNLQQEKLLVQESPKLSNYTNIAPLTLAARLTRNMETAQCTKTDRSFYYQHVNWTRRHSLGAQPNGGRVDLFYDVPNILKR